MKRSVLASTILVLALAVVAITVLAQGNDAPTAHPQGDARVRVVHASPDAPAVDVLVEGAVAFSNLAFTDISEYAALPAGDYLVQVVPTGATEPIVISATLTLDPDVDYTVVATDLLANITPLVLVDDNSAPAVCKAHVRFVHASPDAPAVDIAVAGGPVLFGGVAFQETTAYLPVGAGTYDLEVRLAGTTTVVLSVPGVTLNDGTIYTVFAMGLAAGDPPLEAVLSVDAGNARVRVAHASPDAPAVDVLVEGAVAFSNLAFTEISKYATLPAGDYLVQVVPTGATEPVVISATLTFDADVDYTVVATDLLANITPLVLVDDNSAPAAGKAHVRVVHASPDAPAVDIAVAGGAVLFGDVAFQETTAYLPVGAGTYDLEVRLAGTTTVVLSVPGVTLNDGTIYTVFAMGLAAGDPPLEAVPSVDNEGSITITKLAPGASASHPFGFTGDLGSFTLTSGESTQFLNLTPGTYTVAEDAESFPDEFWSLLTATCVDPMGQRVCTDVDLENLSAAIHLRPGQHLNCTFQNERVDLEVDYYQYLPLILR